MAWARRPRDEAKDEGFYLVVLPDGEHRQLRHTVAGGLSSRTMALETETAARNSEVTTVQVFRATLGTRYIFQRIHSVFCCPLNHDIVPASQEHHQVRRIATGRRQRGNDSSSAVSVLENTCVAASRNGFMHYIIPGPCSNPHLVISVPVREISGLPSAGQCDQLTHSTELPSQV